MNKFVFSVQDRVIFSINKLLYWKDNDLFNDGESFEKQHGGHTQAYESDILKQGQNEEIINKFAIYSE